MADINQLNQTSLLHINENANDSAVFTSTFNTNFPRFVHKISPCTDEHAERFCDLITDSMMAHEKANSIDLNNMKESGWIWASFGVYTPLCLFGIIGNILTIIMFSHYIKKTTTSVFIIALAIVDLLVCSISLPIWLYTLINEHHGSEVLCKSEKLVYFIAIPLSACILLVIAIDRFLLIFVGKTNVVTRFRAKLIIFFLSLACLALAIPQTLSFTTMYKLDEKLVANICKGSINCNTLKCRPTTEYISTETWYYLWQALVISFLLMVIAFSTIYSLIFAKVYSLHLKMMRWRKPSQDKNQNSKKIHADHATFSSENVSERNSENGNSSNKNGVKSESNRASTQKMGEYKKKKKKSLPHLHTARTLFMVTSCFILAYAPLILMMFMGSCESKGPNDYEEKCGRNDYRKFLWHFYYFHHVINPIIYSFMNPRFRDALRKCLKSGCCNSSS